MQLEAQATTREKAHAAAWALIGFDAYPRPSDLANVRVADVHVPSPNSKGIAARTCLTFNPSSRTRVSKTNCQDDTVVVSQNEARAGVPALLHAMVEGRRGDELLFAVSTARMRELLTEAADQAQLERITPHQLRHGGASHDGATGCSLEQIQSRGAWATASSVRRYAKPGRYLRLLASIPEAERERLSAELPALVKRLCAKVNKFRKSSVCV